MFQRYFSSYYLLSSKTVFIFLAQPLTFKKQKYGAQVNSLMIYNCSSNTQVFLIRHHHHLKGLEPHKIVLPVRHFYVQLIDLEGYPCVEQQLYRVK